MRVSNVALVLGLAIISQTSRAGSPCGDPKVCFDFKRDPTPVPKCNGVKCSDKVSVRLIQFQDHNHLGAIAAMVDYDLKHRPLADMDLVRYKNKYMQIIQKITIGNSRLDQDYLSDIKGSISGMDGRNFIFAVIGATDTASMLGQSVLAGHFGS